MNADRVLQKHDFNHSDRLREEIIMETRQPGGLYFLARHVLGFTRLSEKVHKPFSVWYETELRKPHALITDRDPRGSGKTTLANTSLPPWVFLQEPEAGTPLQGLNTRFGVVAPKRDLAAFGPVLTMRDLFDTCETWKALTFDIVVPRRDLWSLTHGLGFKRSDPSGGPNIVPLGMESVTTGMHPHIFLVDDPLNEQNYQSLTLISQIKDWISKSSNLTESVQGARVFIGNIWAINDPQDWLRPETEVDGKRIFEHIKTWERGLEACSVCIGGRPIDHMEQDHVGDIIPVRLDNKIGTDPDTGEDITAPATMDDVRRIQDSTDRVTLQAQYYNRPVAPGILQFDLRDLKGWGWEQRSGGNDNEAALLISAPILAATEAIKRRSPYFINDGRRGVFERIPISHLDIYILVDPAPSKEESAGHSRFAIGVEGCERSGLRQFHMDEYAKNAPPQHNLDAILDFYLKWFPFVKKIGIESVAYQATIGDSLLDRARDRHIATLKDSMIVMLPRLRSEGAQEDRIRYTLMPLFTGGNFYVHDTHRIIKGEVATFGMAGAKHDLLDALSNLSRVRGRVAGRRGGEAFAAAAAARKRLDGAGQTGYGG